MTRTDPTIRLFAITVTAIIAGLLWFSMTAMARADSTTIIEVPSATRYSHQQPSYTSDTNAAGQTCDVWFEETNQPQPSAHPGNTLTLSTGGNIIAVMDVERSRGGSNSMQILGVVVGETMTVEWVMGPDNVSSNGATSNHAREATELTRSD